MGAATMSVAQLTGATYPLRGSVAGSGKRRVAQRKSAASTVHQHGGRNSSNLYRTFVGNSGEAPWAWNPHLTGPPKKPAPIARPEAEAPWQRQPTMRTEEPKHEWKGSLRAWSPTSRFNLGMGSTREITNAIDSGRQRRVPSMDMSGEAQAVLESGPLKGAQQPNLVHTLRTGDVESYAFKCPPGMDPNNT